MRLEERDEGDDDAALGNEGGEHPLQCIGLAARDLGIKVRYFDFKVRMNIRYLDFKVGLDSCEFCFEVGMDGFQVGFGGEVAVE